MLGDNFAGSADPFSGFSPAERQKFSSLLEYYDKGFKDSSAAHNYTSLSAELTETERGRFKKFKAIRDRLNPTPATLVTPMYQLSKQSADGGSTELDANESKKKEKGCCVLF